MLAWGHKIPLILPVAMKAYHLLLLLSAAGRVKSVDWYRGLWAEDLADLERKWGFEV